MRLDIAILHHRDAVLAELDDEILQRLPF
jgi:hypothetical protein